MGKKRTESAFKQLSKELPPVKRMERDEYWVSKDVGMKVFGDEKDREQFIWALISVATQNGIIDLDDHDFKLLYSRRGENNERVVARLVAIKDGIIKAKIEPQADGENQAEAFKAFRKDVEVQLEQILQSVPSGSSSTATGSSGVTSPVPADAPPAYSNSGVGIADQKTRK